jgi:long-subunit acyl-CoA synthetase (AMP-forming)
MSETVPQLFDRAVIENARRPALAQKIAGAWKTTSYHDYRQQVRRTAKALVRLGLRPRSGVAILGYNRPEWFLANFGAIHAGGVPAGIYTTSTAEQIRYIAHHCEAAVMVVENSRYLETVLSVRAELPHLQAIVVMEGGDGGQRSEGVWAWEDFLRLADEVPEADLERRIDALGPQEVCTLIYTSGTTGTPKAVMISHANVTWLAEKALPLLKLGPSDRVLSYLPLSHIAEQCMSIYIPLAAGGCTYFAESFETLPENLREVLPTLFLGVPRVWEKIQAKIQAAGAAAPPLRRRIAAWARRVGLAGGYAEQRGGRKPFGYALAKRLVFDTVRARLGLTEARVCITSAAPISLGTLEFFLSLGIPLLEIYGMSEVTGPGTMSIPERYRTGRAGFAIPGTEIRIAGDGEVLMRGPHVFLGYLKDAAATAETLDGEGWVHSGDIGELDGDGFLKITDRKKELLVTSGGKKTAPAPIEAMLKSIPGVAQAVLLGDRRNFIAALLALDPERVAAVAAAAGSPARDCAAASTCAAFRAYLEKQVETVNQQLARYEAIRAFDVLPHELTIEGGELTPTMKLKRRVILEKYGERIERLYAG